MTVDEFEGRAVAQQRKLFDVSNGSGCRQRKWDEKAQLRRRDSHHNGRVKETWVTNLAFLLSWVRR
jgi:hypothetical protein